MYLIEDIIVCVRSRSMSALCALLQVVQRRQELEHALNLSG